jgi:hypothetical protein
MCKDCGCTVANHSHEHSHKTEHLHSNPQLNDSKTIEFFTPKMVAALRFEFDRLCGVVNLI